MPCSASQLTSVQPGARETPREGREELTRDAVQIARYRLGSYHSRTRRRSAGDGQAGKRGPSAFLVDQVIGVPRGSAGRRAYGAVPHSVPLMSHCGVSPSARWLASSCVIFSLVALLASQSHNWLAQQLQSAAVSALKISREFAVLQTEAGIEYQSRDRSRCTASRHTCSRAGSRSATSGSRRTPGRPCAVDAAAGRQHRCPGSYSGQPHSSGGASGTQPPGTRSQGFGGGGRGVVRRRPRHRRVVARQRRLLPI